MTNLAASIRLTLLDAFSNPMSVVKNSLSGMKQGLNNMKAGKDFGQLATELTLQAAYFDQLASGIKNFINEPAKLASNLKDSMASVHSVLNEQNAINGDIKKSYDRIKKASLDFSKTHSVTATDFTKANYNMLSAGLNTQQSIAGTSQALKLAKATMGESSEAGNLLATIYNNMGDKSANVTTEMQRLSDVVAQTQATFQIANLGQLSEGLKYAIPSALQYKMSLEQVSAVVGQLNTSGLQGSMAGTSFNAMMAQMLKASNALGFNISYDESGGLNLISTLQNIKNQFGSFDTMSNTMKENFSKAFGQEGLRGVTLLLSNLDALQNNFGLVSNSTGITETMYKRMTDTIKDKMQITENRWDALKIKIGEQVNFIQLFGNSIKSKVLDVLEIIPEKPAQVMFGLAAGLGTAASAGLSFAGSGLNVAAQIATIANVASQGKNILGLFGNMAGLVTLPFKMLAGGILKLIPIIWSFSASLLTCPITWIIIGVIALAGAVFLLIKNWKAVSTFFVNLWNSIVGIFKKAWDFIWNGLLNNKFIQVALAVFFPFIGLPILIVKNWGKIFDFFKSIPGFFVSLWNSIVSIFTKAWNFIWNSLLNNKYIQIALTVFAPFIGIPILIIKNFGAIKTFFIGLWNGIVGIFNAGVGFIKGLINEIVNMALFIPNLIGSLFNFGKKVPQTMAKGVKQDNSLSDAMLYNFQTTQPYIPQSDAKKGPFSQLTLAGRKIISTMSLGVTNEAPVLDEAVKKSFNVLDNAPGGLKVYDSGNNKGDIHIHIGNIEAIAKDVKDIKSLKEFVDMLASICGVTI